MEGVTGSGALETSQLPTRVGVAAPLCTCRGEWGLLWKSEMRHSKEL